MNKRIILGLSFILIFLMVLPSAIGVSFLKENQVIQKDKKNIVDYESQGCYTGIIYGEICNLQGSEDRVNFFTISVTIIPGFHHLIQRDAWIKKPYFGIITPKFILILGAIYSGW